MFFKIVILKNFTTFTRKHLRWSHFLIMVQTWKPAFFIINTPGQVFFSVNIAKFFNDSFFIEHLLFIIPPVHDRILLTFFGTKLSFLFYISCVIDLFSFIILMLESGLYGYFVNQDLDKSICFTILFFIAKRFAFCSKYWVFC